jgi:superfamily II DNA or RNA helicase
MGRLPTEPHTRPPDWSFQDVAVRRCVDALQRQGRRVGLVVPTGGGKTRMALVVALRLLDQDSSGTRNIIWVTHRKNLHSRARRELQSMASESLAGASAVDTRHLVNRFIFAMVSEVSNVLASVSELPLLIIVDECHHLAAPSYAPILDHTPRPSVLALTATPNRTDRQSLGLDEIAFTITFRELVERGVVLMPEFRDFPVPSFDWDPTAVDALAADLIVHAQNEYVKTLIIAPRIERVESFYDALLRRLQAEQGHILTSDDVVFVHSLRNSMGVTAEEVLAEFASRPRGIMVSAQMLLEGFDDPSINTVVMTYPTTSKITLMQAAGRCVRYAPGKRASFVVQARNDDLAYHFEQRWLHQEINDHLRPFLQDIDYHDAVDLRNKVDLVLQSHRVDATNAGVVLRRIEKVAPGETCRLLLCGLPYFGALDSFSTHASWAAVAETPNNDEPFRTIFNDYCELGADLTQEEPFLRQHARSFGIPQDSSPGTDWQLYTTMLVSMREARREIYGEGHSSVLGEHRPYRPCRATTWLRYITFRHRPQVPARLEAFLIDCYNRDDIIVAYQADPSNYARVIKLPLPLGGAEAHLLGSEAAAALDDLLDRARTTLINVHSSDQHAALQAFVLGLSTVQLPLRVVVRLEHLLNPNLSDRCMLLDE